MSPEAALHAALATTGQVRLISPEDVARAVRALCEDAGATNGETVVIAEGGARS